MLPGGIRLHSCWSCRLPPPCLMWSACVVCAGGFLGQAYGWQAPFIALLVFAAGVILPATVLLVKETLQYKTISSLSPAEAATVKEAPSILANPPRFGSVWAPLVAVCDKRVVLHLIQATVGFACMLSAQIELPGQLIAPPYSMGPGHIGAAMVAAGGAGMIASPVGGKLFDKAAAKPGPPMLRLTSNSLASLIGEWPQWRCCCCQRWMYLAWNGSGVHSRQDQRTERLGTLL